MTYPGRRFDGLTAQGVEVVVAAGPQGLTVVPAGGGPTELWKWDELRPSDLSRSGDQLVVRRGAASVQARAEGLEQALRQAWPRADLFRSPFHVWTATPARYALTLGAAAALLAAAFFWGVPAAGDAVAGALPDDWSREAGAALKTQVTAGQRVDPEGSAALQAFWNALDLPAGPTEVTWVDDGSTVNAFALMGGQVLVYRGLLEECRSADELAGVLAHEAGHGVLRHSARMAGRSLAGAFLLGYLLGDPSGITGAVLGNADALRQLQFSREMESEADAWAARALRGKADIRALGALLGRIDPGKNPGWAGFLASHPATGDRQASWNQPDGLQTPPAGGKLAEAFAAVMAALHRP